MKNLDSSGSPILTDRAIGSLRTFIELCTFDELSSGIRNLLLQFLIDENGGEIWFNAFLEQLRLFYDFIDVLGEEYPGI